MLPCPLSSPTPMPKGTPDILAVIGVGYGKSPEHKSCNVSEMRQDRAKLTINCLYKVIHKESIGAKVYDLE